MHKVKYNAKVKKEKMNENITKEISDKYDNIVKNVGIEIKKLNFKLNEKKCSRKEKDDLTIKIFNLEEIIKNRKENEKKEISDKLKNIEIEKC